MLGFSNKTIADLLYWVTRKRWLIAAFAISLFLFYIPSPASLSPEGHRTLIIVVIALILIIGEVIPLPAVAILILILEVVLGIDTPNGVATSFMSDAVFFIMGSLMMAVAIVSQGLDKRLALSIIKLTGNKTWRIVFGFVAISTILLFSIAYGCAMGSIGTPSGGGRNVIMLGYFSEFGLGNISYLDWIKYAYPMLLLEIPIASGLLWMTFKPEQRILDSAVRKLKVKVTKAGKVTGNQMMAIGIFVFVFLGWIFLSPYLGLGIVALIGVFLYLSFGLIEWQDINRNTNWGVILLFGAAISLGIQMKETGAAEWLATQSINGMSMLINDVGFMQWFISVFLTGILTNFLSNAATVAILGPVVLDMGGNPIVLGLSTSIASAFSYLTIVASPTCMIIHSSGLVKSSDYLKAGWKLFVISVFILYLVSNLYWPYLS
jgi:sodium-dependent dicarboxylate transporter 2/3/5